MKYKVDIQPSQLVMTASGSAGINSAAVATYLARESVDAIADLSHLYGTISADQITISPDGIIFIDNDAFKKKVKDFINNPVAPVSGFGCENGSCSTI